MTSASMRRWRRACCLGTGSLAFAVGSAVVPAAPAIALGPEVSASDQEYYSYYQLGSLHSQGYNGEGTVIAMSDGHVTPNIPELAGATIENKSPCTVRSLPDNADHGTAVAQVLVAPKFGVAPGATLYTYDLGYSEEEVGADCANPGVYARGEADTSLLIEQAINDGADIISISSSYPMYNEDLRWAMARAISQGVIVVAAMGNDSTEDPEDTLPLWSGICGVGAIDTNGALTEYSNWGNGVETVALGTITVRSGTRGEVLTIQGTSFATPIVAGFLAIAWQRFDDDVTANQILQAMTTTGKGSNGEWNYSTGFGAADPWGLLNAKAASLPDVNPCESKAYSSSPSWQDVEDYIDGTVNPLLMRNDDDYVYRGFNEEAAFSPDNDYPVHLGTSPRYHRD